MSEILNVTTLPPPITIPFNRWLLDPVLGCFHDAFALKQKANKKIRPQDVGRRREFDKLLKDVEQMHERYKLQKEI